jgi:hypothetical protein
MFCPYVVYFLYAGFLCSEKKKIICAATAIVFILSVYQGFLMIIFSGVFISFLILQENTGYESKVYMRLCLKLFFAVLLAGAFYYLIIYKLISPRILPFTFNSEYNENFYLGKWLKRPFIESVLAVLSQGYILTIGDIPLVQRIVHPIISQINHPEVPSLARIADESRAFGNVLLLPAAVFFLISIVRKACSDLPKGRRLLYVLAGIGVPISIIMFNIITGSTLPYRTLLALPLAMGFMCFYLIKRWKKKPALILSLLALIISVRQMEITAVLAYSERKLYNAEVRLAADINRRIMEIQPEPKKLPVAFIGSYDQTIPNLLRTRESFSRRFFNSTFGPFIFMPFLGYSYELPQNSQWGMITAEAASMPSYPAPGSVQRRANVIVVKLSDDPAAWPRQYGMDIHQWLGR